MGTEALARVALDRDVASALEAVPAGPGVGQILGPEGRSLLLATSSNLRRWAASNLGQARPARAKPGALPPRPKTSLAGIATGIAWLETDGSFRQRLAYERLAAVFVPASARRDLKPPAFLRLEPAERFPRVTLQAAESDACYGPFRDRGAAEKARDAVQRAFELRPCDFTFEPDPALPLGLACIYAQVRSCAAPCLARVGEDGYRGLAARAAAWLAEPGRRENAPAAVPATIAAAAGRALVVDRGKRGVGLYPVRAGRVLDAAAVVAAPAELASALPRLAWPETSAPSDWPWLTSWLRGPKARAAFVVVQAAWSAPQLHDVLRRAQPAVFAAPPGGNVGLAREDS